MTAGLAAGHGSIARKDRMANVAAKCVRARTTGTAPLAKLASVRWQALAPTTAPHHYLAFFIRSVFRLSVLQQQTARRAHAALACQSVVKSMAYPVGTQPMSVALTVLAKPVGALSSTAYLSVGLLPTAIRALD